MCDGGSVEAEDLEIVHLQRVAGSYAQDAAKVRGTGVGLARRGDQGKLSFKNTRRGGGGTCPTKRLMADWSDGRIQRESAAAAMGQINQAWIEGRVEDLGPMVHPEIVTVFPSNRMRRGSRSGEPY